MADPALHQQQTATALGQQLAEGSITATAIVESCLDHIAARDATVHAWTHLAGEAALARAKALDEAGADARSGLLFGIPVGVKDIMDTVDMPTCYGSSIYASNQPAWDASCVSLVREAGGLVLGKTVTTEFAYFQPGPTANPHNPNYTPGGSSSGSAAAVADGQVPLAFGSQTAGSVIRPASYCGVVGFKPSHGKHSLAGVKALAHSLDTLGWFARAVDDIALMRSALLGEAQPLGPEPETPPRIGLCHSPLWDKAETATRDALAAAAQRFKDGGAWVSEHELPPVFEDLAESQRRLMNYEVARELAFERRVHWESLSDVLRANLDDGLACSEADYEQARTHGRAARAAFADVMADIDILLTPSAPGEAPAGLDATGDPMFNRIWTLLGVPALNLPGHRGPNRLPVGVQLIGSFGADHALLRWGRWAEAQLR